MENICKFCNKTFQTNSNLLKHQKTAKFCLVIQNKEIEVKINCQYCSKYFSRKDNLKDHIKICKTKLEEDNNKIKIRLEEDNNKIKNNLDKYIKNNEKLKLELNQTQLEIEKIKIQLNCKDDMLKQKDETITKLQNELKYFHEKALEKVNVITQVHNANTNNIVNNKSKMIQALEPLTYKDIEQQNQYLQIENVKNHANSLAEFYYKNVLKGRLIVNDKSRLIFSFKDEFGNINRDEGGIKLSNMIINTSREQIMKYSIQFLTYLDTIPRSIRDDNYYDLCSNLGNIIKVCKNKNNPNNSQFFESFRKTFMNHLKELITLDNFNSPPSITFEESSTESKLIIESNTKSLKAIEEIRQDNDKKNKEGSAPLRVNDEHNFVLQNRYKIYPILVKYRMFLDKKAEQKGDYDEDEDYLSSTIYSLELIENNSYLINLYNTSNFVKHYYKSIQNLNLYKNEIIEEGYLTQNEINLLLQK